MNYKESSVEKEVPAVSDIFAVVVIDPVFLKNSNGLKLAAREVSIWLTSPLVPTDVLISAGIFVFVVIQTFLIPPNESLQSLTKPLIENLSHAIIILN